MSDKQTETQTKPARRTEAEVTEALKGFSIAELSAEVVNRGKIVCDGSCDEGRGPDDFNEDAAEVARYSIARGELSEAAIYIARAHHYFEDLPALIERARFKAEA